MKKILLASALLAIISFADAQNLKTPSPSPRQTVVQEFGLGEVTLSYSRPSAKGRVIYGDLVPFDKVWRTGANNPTTLTFTEEVIIGGKKIAAGKYGLITIPGKTTWKIIISKQTDINSPSAYKAENNLAEVTATVQKPATAVETFTIDFGTITNETMNLNISWGNAMVTLPIKSENDTKVVAQINELMNAAGDKKPYFQAAMYYLDNNKELNKANEWMQKAAAESPEAFWIFYHKARLEAKLGKKTDAIASSKKSLDLAKKANWADYIKLNEDLLKTLQ
ncbi:DUF2911 domain-containing protein [Gynurincola endophyticus]|uniref:DUF2911 domain-containing protein n=1 Tax=Gynurincola endophyticus TaxID=2479004 RepID=UPI000F8EAC68|nr:DUF2911 domain-containing protein [Gynurincola endophyticus]